MDDLTPVTSSNIAAIGYKPDEKLLTIRFKNGGVYQHHDVSQEAYDGLMAAKSKGGHYASTIRGKFKHTKVWRDGERS
jgi:hypothetical protein